MSFFVDDAGVADTAAAPLCTLKTLIQTGRGLSALHTKAVELLDGKGKPVKEHGVVKLVHVPLSPAQVSVPTVLCVHAGDASSLFGRREHSLHACVCARMPTRVYIFLPYCMISLVSPPTRF